MLSKNEVQGKSKQIEGAVKIKVGELTNNPLLEAKGEAQRLEGIVQEKAGKALRTAGDAMEKAGKTIPRKR